MPDDRWSPYEDEEADQLAVRALAVECPRCGRPAGHDCYSWTEQTPTTAHPSRVVAALAAGK